MTLTSSVRVGPPRVGGRQQPVTTRALAPLFIAAGTLAGCGVEFQNTRAAQDYARQSQPSADLQAGQRVFEAKCALCHGSTAEGGSGGPNLLARIQAMGPRRFESLVLLRHDWPLITANAGRAADVQGAKEAPFPMAVRPAGASMPAWSADPLVAAHVDDLYAYLVARSAGTLNHAGPR